MRKLSRIEIITLRTALMHAVAAHEHACAGCAFVIRDTATTATRCDQALRYKALDDVMRAELVSLAVDGAA